MKYLLNVGRSQNVKIARKITTYLGRVKEKRRELGPDLHTGKGAVKDERFPHSGKTLHQWEDQPGQKGSFRGSESATASCQQAVQRLAERIHVPCCNLQPKMCAC